MPPWRTTSVNFSTGWNDNAKSLDGKLCFRLLCARFAPRATAADRNNLGSLECVLLSWSLVRPWRLQLAAATTSQQHYERRRKRHDRRQCDDGHERYDGHERGHECNERRGHC